MDFNWISNGSSEPWNSVFINSTGQNAVACMTPSGNFPNPNFLYYYTNNSGWNSSTINNPPQDSLIADEHQLSMSNSNSFVSVRTNPANSFLSYYYSSNNGVNYDVAISGNGGEIPYTSSINSSGYWLSCSNGQAGVVFAGNVDNSSNFIELDLTGGEGFCALSDTNYGFICSNSYTNSNPPPAIIASSFIYSYDIAATSPTWINDPSIFVSTTIFTGISSRKNCSEGSSYKNKLAKTTVQSEILPIWLCWHRKNS